MGEKSIAMIAQKELLPLTGYVHGGCSPVGMKKQYPTVFDETAEILDTIMRKLWDYQQGKIEQSDFVHFANCLDAITIEIATGDTEKMDEDEVYYDFKAEHFWNWDGSYNSF